MFDSQPETGHAFVGVTGKGEFCEVSRSRNGANNIQKLYGPAKPPATWVKLVRKGSTITSFTSINGKQWTQAGSSTAEFGPTCYVGLLASGGNAKSASAEFRAVKVSP